MIITSGDIDRPYEIIGLASVLVSDNIVDKAYKKAIKELEKSARKMGADAVTFMRMSNAMATQWGCLGQRQVLVLFVWGTAVKFTGKEN